jgi:CAAX prenyl protease-like protein
MLPRVLPFALYIGFIALSELMGWISPHLPAVAALGDTAALWLYPLKTAAVLVALLYFGRRYDELQGKTKITPRDVFIAVSVGIIIYLIWVRIDWPWAQQGQASGYNPFSAGGTVGSVLATIRMVGAVLVVPVMEELFWRSFLLRYLISPRFETVPLGAFTLFSFLATTILFGLDHHLWLAGMIAGAAYTLLLYSTGRLWTCIIAHAVTNLALGVHVLLTQEWTWW